MLTAFRKHPGTIFFISFLGAIIVPLVMAYFVGYDEDGDFKGIPGNVTPVHYGIASIVGLAVGFVFGLYLAHRIEIQDKNEGSHAFPHSKEAISLDLRLK